MITRIPIERVEMLNSLDNDDVVEGYMDWVSGDSEPGDNRSYSYWHG